MIALGVQEVENVLGRSFPLIIIRNKAREILLGNEEFKGLSGYYMDLILDTIRIQNLESGGKISSE